MMGISGGLGIIAQQRQQYCLIPLSDIHAFLSRLQNSQTTIFRLKPSHEQLLEPGFGLLDDLLQGFHNLLGTG